MNDENLIPTTKRSESEAREMGKKGGIASGKSRRKKKTLKQIAELIGNSTDSKNKDKIKKQFNLLENEDITYNVEIIIAMYQKALKGDVKAVNFIADILGESAKNSKLDDDSDMVMKFIEGMIDD